MKLKNKRRFVITAHAEEKMLERFCCDKGKIKKIAIKAWRSNDKVNKLWEYRKYREYDDAIYRYKYFLGHIFVFRLDEIKYKKVLITVYSPKKQRELLK